MFELNNEQEVVAQNAVEWFYKGTDQVFQFAGGPGTGKSVLLNEIITRLGLDPLTEIAAMSFIGSASLVMRLKGLSNAKTAHSWLFDVQPVPMRDEFGSIIYDELLNVPIMVPRFIPRESLPETVKLIVVDEAYSMPLSLRPEIEKFGIKIIACGDSKQLPPVNDQPAFLASGKVYYLTECMRQAESPDISYIANMASKGVTLLNGYYGNSLVIDELDLTDEMLLMADAVICGTNATRDIINKRIRSLLGYGGKLPQYGERLVARKNNWVESVTAENGYELNIVNGLMGTVCNNPDVSSYDGKLFSINFCPELAPEMLFINSRVNYQHMISDNKTRVKIRNNRYQPGNMFEYAYCITCHIAQGSQFHNVVYLDEHMPSEIKHAVDLVGASRADNTLIYVKNFNRRRYE